MKNKELCKVYETEYSSRYNTYIKVYCDNNNKYRVAEKDLDKKRPVYVYKAGKLFSVCFMVTTKPKFKELAIKWPKDGRWDDKDRWIMFQPILIPNNQIWQDNEYPVPEHIIKIHYNGLVKSSSKKNPSKNYLQHLNDSVRKLDQF